MTKKKKKREKGASQKAFIEFSAERHSSEKRFIATNSQRKLACAIQGKCLNILK